MTGREFAKEALILLSSFRYWKNMERQCRKGNDTYGLVMALECQLRLTEALDAARERLTAEDRPEPTYA